MKNQRFLLCCLIISLQILISVASAQDVFLNSGSSIEPYKAMMYYPHYFQRNTDSSIYKASDTDKMGNGVKRIFVYSTA